MSNDTWAIVIATFMGPIFAVWIALWREERNDRRNRRFYIFRTLMATRKIAMSREQVDALNLVETEFQGVPKVQAAYASYIRHLYTDVNSPDWDERRQDHLARVLHHMSVEMGMPLSEADLRSGGYSPRGWTVRNDIEQYLHDVAMNKASIPMRIVGTPPSGRADL
ncbi:MAG: DUF6680 family protein [Reyranella sp.]|jgi:hypothetical protein